VLKVINKIHYLLSLQIKENLMTILILVVPLVLYFSRICKTTKQTYKTTTGYTPTKNIYKLPDYYCSENIITIYSRIILINRITHIRRKAKIGNILVLI